jgi:hypothetical protein
MCHNYAKHFFLFSILLASGFSSFAQSSNRENAPYSRYGIGELRNGNNTVLKGMGNISSAYSNGFNVNTDNPASYSSLKLVTYEAGGEGSTRSIIANNQNVGTGTATLSHLTIGIPLGKGAGMALGLRPFTRVYYRMNDSLVLDGLGPALKSYSGDGSVNYAFIGGAYEFKGLSVGFNFGYLFGTVRNSVILQKQYDTVNAYNSDFSKYTKVGGLYYKLGLQYQTKLNEKMRLRLGGTVALTQSVNAWQDNYALLWRPSGTGVIYDTATRGTNVRGNVKLPLSYSAGAQLVGNDQWMAGIDFSAAQWSQFRHFGDATDSVGNSYKIGVGGEFTPDPTSLYKYLSRVTYRLGFYYGKDFVTLRNTDINFYAVTVGASLPFRRATDRVHFALEIGRRGTEANGLVRENFFRFHLGISLNDRWFVKRKYD